MGGCRFYRYELRTTDVDSARAFFAGVLGPQLWRPGVSIAPLPERAVARGAPPHWLGHVHVPDVEETVARVVAEGGQQLGPIERGTDGSLRAIVRDPFGAILAVTTETPPDSEDSDDAPVAWHLHHSEDHERAFAFYSALFGWASTGAQELGPELGSHRPFAWQQSGPIVGSMANTARLPHVHPQWLFFFRVADIEESLARVDARGGKPLTAIRTSGGDLAAPCNDPQGAAFALYQPADEL